ncbi:MAG: hypothetical protein QW607_01225 [Desulfurococcaceae archaeon]
MISIQLFYIYSTLSSNYDSWNQLDLLVVVQLASALVFKFICDRDYIGNC